MKILKYFLLLALANSLVLHAFPPAPFHLFYGMVRDEYGNPIMNTDADIIFETLSGAQLKTKINTNLPAGSNYRLRVPMDAGITTALYKATAVKPTVQFRIKVKIGSQTYLPIEMAADYSRLGQPGAQTHLNLTLGEDSDGDGLPDAWERALIEMKGGGLTLADIRPGDDSDGDGMSNLDEYLAGTYAFDDANGFTLAISSFHNGNPVLQFTAVRGRTYTVQGSDDLATWAPVSFQISGSGASQDTYLATDVRPLQVEVISDATRPTLKFFRLMLK